MCVGRICCILVAIPSCVQVSGEVGKTCTTLRTARCIQQLTKGKVPASGAACFIYFQQREPKCKGWSEFALWKLPVWNSPSAPIITGKRPCCGVTPSGSSAPSSHSLQVGQGENQKGRSMRVYRLRERQLPGKAKATAPAKQNKESICCFMLAGRCSATSRGAGLSTHDDFFGIQMPSLQTSPLLLLSPISYCWA